MAIALHPRKIKVSASAKALILLGCAMLLSACAGNPTSSEAKRCRDGLAVAYQELDFARTKGFEGKWQYTKASALLGAAKVQEEFGKYPNCIDKVERARRYIKLSMQPE